MKAMFVRFLGCTRGAVAIDYGLIASLIAVTPVGACDTDRDALGSTFD